MRPIINILLALICALPALAYTAPKGVPFNGLILDAELKPIKSVRVYNKDRNRYAKSDKKGRFGLTDVAPTDTITIEYKKQKHRIPVDSCKSLKIILGNEIQAHQDDELVNEGYGYVKRREYAGSSSGISGDQLRRSGARNIVDALSGMVAGMTVGIVDVERVISLRGQRSLMLSNQPLFIVDGSPVETLDFVSIYDVDHIEVLKTASQYGVRGANGAIVVTTLSAGRTH